MKNANRTIGALGCWAVLFSTFGAFAQDWPEWRGANRAGKVSGFTAPQAWPKELTQKWKVTVGLGDATPALVGEKLYVFTRQGDEEVTLCLNAADGNEIWRNKYTAQAVTGPPGQHPGPRSSPTVAEGMVVTLGVGGILSCLDATTGHEVWRKDEFPKVVPQFFTAMSPIIVNGVCIAHLGGKDNGAVTAFNLATGDQAWKWTGEGPAYASPVLMTVEGTQQVVVQTEKSLIGLRLADGKLLWQVPAAPQGRAYNSATPIITGTTVIYTGQGRGTRAVKVAKRADAAGDFAATELWSNDKLGTGYNTPVLKDGLLFGLSDRGNFFCLNAQTGEAAWTDTTKRENFGAILEAGSVLLALPSSSELFVFKPDSKQYAEIAHYKVADTATYAHPIVSGKRVFVKDRDSMVLWTIE